MDVYASFLITWHGAHGFFVALASDEEVDQRAANTGKS